MKYRVLSFLGLLALTAGSLTQAQDYDDIYYNASSPKTTESKTVKVTTPAKTVAVYGNVPEKYKVAVQNNYRVERDEDEYNRRGNYELDYAVSLDGDTLYADTIYDEAFANTRRIERFYNPDIVILSDDEDLVELYYDESPTINLIIGSDYSYADYGWSSFYYPWSGRYWYWSFYDPWYSWGWHYGFNSYYGWHRPYYFGHWYGPSLWGWNYWGPHGGHYWGHVGWNNWTWNGGHVNHWNHNNGTGWHDRGGRVNMANNRNGRGRVGGTTGSTGRNGISRPATGGNRPTGVGNGNSGSRPRPGTGVTRSGGNMTSRSSSGVTTRSSSGSNVSRSSSIPRSSGSSSSYGGSRSSGSSSRSSSGTYNSGSRSSGGSHSSGGSYSGGGSRSGGGGGTGGSSGGGGRRR